MRLLVAPASFKGSLSAIEAVRALCQGAHAAAEQSGTPLEVRSAPLSDGGEGFLETVSAVVPGVARQASCQAVDDPRAAALAALKRGGAVPPTEVSAMWWWDERTRTAYGESAEIVGLSKTTVATPFTRTAAGIGQYLEAMRQAGARHIVLGIGGTATVELGTTVAAALGARFLLGGRPFQLRLLSHLDGADRVEAPPPWEDVVVTSWCDVLTPLADSARLFARQKGASDAEVTGIQQRLKYWVKLVGSQYVTSAACLGAGGGIPLGVGLGTGGKAIWAMPQVAQLLDLRGHIEWADEVWTGEGRVDATTLEGKVVSHVLSLARQAHKRVVVFAGTADNPSLPADVRLCRLDAHDSDVERAMAEAGARLQAAAATQWHHSQLEHRQGGQPHG